MSDIELKLNELDMLKVKTMLSGVKNGASKVIVRAVNKTLTGVKTDSDREVREIITMKKADVMATFSQKKATAYNMTAMVKSSSEPVPLIKFTNRQLSSGISVKVLKSQKPTKLMHAFYATFPSKDKGIYERKNVVKSGKPKKNINYAALPYRYRFPVKELTGPRVTDIMGKPAVIKRITESANERLHKNINYELNYELSKL